MVDTDLVAPWLTPATTCHHSITAHSWDSSLCKKPYRLPKKREAGGLVQEASGHCRWTHLPQLVLAGTRAAEAQLQS